MKLFYKCWKIFHKCVQWTQEQKISFLQTAINFLFIVIFTNEIPKQFTVILFAAKGMIYLLCSHIKGDLFTYEDNNYYFHVWRYHVFTWKLTQFFFIDVYIIKYLSWCYSMVFIVWCGMIKNSPVLLCMQMMMMMLKPQNQLLLFLLQVQVEFPLH